MCKYYKILIIKIPEIQKSSIHVLCLQYETQKIKKRQVTNMNKLKNQNFKNEEIVLDDSAFDSIRKMYFRSIDNTKDQVDHIIVWFEHCLSETKKELANVFTYEEINFLISSHTSIEYSLGYSIKQLLKINMYDEYNYPYFTDYTENVNYDDFMNKLEGLTEFQTFVLIYMVIEFMDNHTFYTKEDLMKSFNIK